MFGSRALVTILGIWLSFAPSVFASVAGVDANVLSYQAWKTNRVDEAKIALARIQVEAQLEKAPAIDRSLVEKTPQAVNAAAGKTAHPLHSARTEQRLNQAQLNVEIAQELSVNDYFILYLNQIKSRDAFVEAAKKLTPEETADLLLSYRNSLAGADQQNTVPSLVNGLGSGPAAKTQSQGL